MKESAFQIVLRTYEPQVKRHTHPFVQTIVPLRGAMEIEIDGRGSRLTPSSVAVLPPGATHDFESTYDGQFLIFELSGSALIDAWLTPDLCSVRQITPTAWRYMQFLASEAALKESQMLASLNVLATVRELLIDAKKSLHSMAPPHPHLEAASRRLTEQACLPLNMADLARDAGLSISRFHRLYRSVYGQSPKQAQLDVRLKCAMELLLASRLSVSAIAYELGYENVSSFTNLFKRRFGMTPARFRALKK
ncbi:AraC family transcriptional regulator [Pistricoccus aurantiacus]|uniref:AraC family transcriptional regulator n=1 Tax=Pistricoccus aurantiacus TaxID=1883414 RepID=UPI00362ADF17